MRSLDDRKRARAQTWSVAFTLTEAVREATNEHARRDTLDSTRVDRGDEDLAAILFDARALLARCQRYTGDGR